MFLESVISPVTFVEDAYILKPFLYNRYSKPRYNITLSFDRNEEGDNAFIEWVDEISIQAEVPPKMWIGRQKLYLIKFQTPDEVKIKEYVSESEDFKEVTITEELKRGSCAQIKFDILKYYNRSQATYGFSFKPIEIYIYPDKTKDFFNVNYKSRGN